jgi:hypothetical protein
VKRLTSLRAFARRLGHDESAVRKAVRSGRLAKSVGRDARGKPVIVDVALATKEWAENASKVTNGNGSLAEAQRLVALERQRALEIRNQQALGKLIPAAQAARDAFEAARVIRDNVLAVPARLAAELAAEPDPAKVHRRLEEELRRALEASAARMRTRA